MLSNLSYNIENRYGDVAIAKEKKKAETRTFPTIENLRKIQIESIPDCMLAVLECMRSS